MIVTGLKRTRQSETHAKTTTQKTDHNEVIGNVDIDHSLLTHSSVNCVSYSVTAADHYLLLA
jgi:hypothetical protein